MIINLLALVTSALLATSPFISRSTKINQTLGLNSGPSIQGDYRWVLMGLGGITLLLSLSNLYTKRRSGMIYIVLGVVCLIVGYFHNNERFPIVPTHNLLLGGGEYLAFMASVLLVLLGLAQEFLLRLD